MGAAAGAGGIGYDLFMSGTMYFDIREIGVFVYLIFTVAIILEFISYLFQHLLPYHTTPLYVHRCRVLNLHQLFLLRLLPFRFYVFTTPLADKYTH